MTRFYAAKAALAAVALALGLAGMATERRALVGGAVTLLAVAVGLRVVERRRPPS